MPERKAKREAARRIVEAASVETTRLATNADIELAMKSAVEAEQVPRADLERRILMEWLLARGYLK